MKQTIFNIIFIATTIFLVQPTVARTEKDTMPLKNPDYFINVFENDKSLFQQGARITLQEWVNPKLRDSIWQQMRGATFDEAARYSKKANKKKEVRLNSGHYKLVGANKIYTFSVNKNGQIDGRLKMEVKPRDEDKANRVTFLRVENGKPLQLILKTDGRLRGKMDFYENTIMIKHFFKEGGRLSEVDSIQKTANGERPKQLLHIEYAPDGKIKEKTLIMNFDGDDVGDTIMLVSAKQGFHYKLIFKLSSRNKPFHIDIVHPYAPDQFPVYPGKLTHAGNVLQYGFGTPGTANYSYFFKLRYKPEVQKIQVIGFDYSYNSGAAGSAHTTLSFNLLTGDFIWQEKYFGSQAGKKTKQRKGVNKNYQNIFSGDINSDLILQLTEIGSKKSKQ